MAEGILNCTDEHFGGLELWLLCELRLTVDDDQ